MSLVTDSLPVRDHGRDISDHKKYLLAVRQGARGWRAIKFASGLYVHGAACGGSERIGTCDARQRNGFVRLLSELALRESVVLM
jgi:hypothetical protein